jgi:nitrate/TMAO reductase-like tetraheme cytochrome c subunit
MSLIRRVWERIRPVSKWQVAFGVTAAIVAVLVVVGGAYAWEYSNSPAFCSSTCHTMPPESAAWQKSPHARVSCVECHLGRDIISTQVTRKLGDASHGIRYISGQFHFPLYAEAMLPAREACEKCHWPEKFSGDRMTEVRHFENDEKNTGVTTYLLMKTGGGVKREGRGFGIHWHIENQIDYITTDDLLKQSIPWIRVTDSTGKQTVYVDIEKPLTSDQIAKAEKRRMDCIDCHNRISHKFLTPDQAIDQGLALRRIDATIPSIKKKGVEVLTTPYKNFDEAKKAIAALDAFYAQNHADYYKANSAKIKAAIDYLKTTYDELVFPTQDLSWTTHPDNIGHKNWPGCFRCHDGKHLTPDNKEAIRLECNVCHTVPEVLKPGGPAPVISVVRADEPDSHRATTWLAQHRTVFDASCQKCHDTNNAGGKDDSSFCANGACHGTEWKFVGLNAPGLAKIFPPPVPRRGDPNVPPKAIPHPIGGSPDCQLCHAQTSKVRPYPVDHVGRKNETCLACHKPAVPAAVTPAATTAPLPSATPTPSTKPTTPAPVAGAPKKLPANHAGRTICTVCHTQGVGPKLPADHANRADGTCTACHTMSSSSAPAAGATPTGAAKPTTPAPAIRGAEKLPADHAGRTVCLACHAQGVGDKLPADHVNRTDDTCKACHPSP